MKIWCCGWQLNPVENRPFFWKIKKNCLEINSLWAFKWAIDETIYSSFYQKIPFVYFESDSMVITLFTRFSFPSHRQWVSSLALLSCAFIFASSLSMILFMALKPWLRTTEFYQTPKKWSNVHKCTHVARNLLNRYCYLYRFAMDQEKEYIHLQFNDRNKILCLLLGDTLVDIRKNRLAFYGSQVFTFFCANHS